MKTFVHLNTSTGGSTGIEHAQGNEFFSAEALSAVAQAAERAGFYGVYVTEHPFPSDARLKAGVGHHSLDPLVPLSVAAAATRRLRLCTHILVLPYRNPFLTARGIASLDVVSGGRVVMGVGTGWMEEEFEALGVNFAERNQLTDEALGAIKLAWTQDDVKLQGAHFRAPGNTMLPKPVQKPHPPIYVGGNSRLAARRAGELGDGFMPFLNPARFAKHPSYRRDRNLRAVAQDRQLCPIGGQERRPPAARHRRNADHLGSLGPARIRRAQGSGRGQ